MPNGTYGGVRGRKTKVGRKLLRFPPTRLHEGRKNAAGSGSTAAEASQCTRVFIPSTILPQEKTRVSRNLVGIIFYTRKVLLTSHYEKRLFEYASQPRVAGSDIRLLSYLWS